VVAARTDFQSLTRADSTVDGDLADLFKRLLMRGMKNPKGFGIHL
jgi:hypothetical protein